MEEKMLYAAKMRMRDLERESGVGRETIRYYIREGLLPEPQRKSRNSALYDEKHVSLLKTIKRLQDERYLPLAVIKSLLDNEAESVPLAPALFPQLDALLAARVHEGAAPEPLAALKARLDLEPEFAEGHLATGMISVDADGNVSVRDAKLLATLKHLSDVGFGSQNGFVPEHMRFFVELMEWVVAQEMRLFFGQLAGQVGEAEAADMALDGINIINDVMAQLHIRGALRALAARAPEAEVTS